MKLRQKNLEINWNQLVFIEYLKYSQNTTLINVMEGQRKGGVIIKLNDEFHLILNC